jgi:hypothetical protein
VMDQEAIEGARMMQAIDQGAIVKAMVQKAVETAIIRNSDGSGSSRRSDGWYHRWIRKQPKERWVCGSERNRR